MKGPTSIAVHALVAASLLVGAGARLVLRANPVQRRWLGRSRRREQELRRLTQVVKQARIPSSASDTSLEGETVLGEMSRYYVPAGLRLDQARAVIGAARLENEDDAPIDTPGARPWPGPDPRPRPLSH